jgi:hypothetical protein
MFNPKGEADDLKNTTTTGERTSGFSPSKQFHTIARLAAAVGK